MMMIRSRRGLPLCCNYRQTSDRSQYRGILYYVYESIAYLLSQMTAG